MFLLPLSIILLFVLRCESNNSLCQLMGERTEQPTLLPHPNCSMFYKCHLGDLTEQKCPSNLHWNKVKLECEPPEKANCIANEAQYLSAPIRNAIPRELTEHCPMDDDQQNPTQLPHPDCTKFYKCYLGEAYEQKCPRGLHWSETKNYCDWPHFADCKDNEAGPQPPPGKRYSRKDNV